jgi:photosystem II stability/assembly factor-like uncharacterized protein
MMVALGMAAVAAAEWRAVGPYGGAAEVVRVARQRPGVLIAATQNALVYRSANGGASWTHVPFPAQLAGALHALEVDPKTPDTWYVGMDSDTGSQAGLYKTIDGGATWTKPAALAGKAIWSVAVWESDPGIVAAGAGDGVYLSRNGGADWRRISPEENRELRPVVSLAFHPRDPNILYAGTTHLPWRTNDGGAHWESIHTGMLDDSDVFSIQVDAQEPRNVFASACSGVYRSGNAGGHWARLKTPSGAFRTYLVALDPRHTGVVFAATSAGLLRSNNSGNTWTRVSPHAVKAIAFDPADRDKVYFASPAGGLLVSTDGGAHLREFNHGFVNRSFVAATGSGDVLYTASVMDAGTGGIFRTDNRGLSWKSVTSAGIRDNMVLMSASSDDANVLFSAGFRAVYRSTDGGISWTSLGSPGGDARVTALLPVSRGVVLAGTTKGLYRHAGNSWTAAGAGSGRVDVVQRTGQGTIGIVTAGGAFRSDDAGGTWKTCGQPVAGAVWYGLTFDTAGARTALAATSRGLYRSADGCVSWQLAGGGLAEGTVSAVLFHPSHPGEAFAAQYGAVYRTGDAGLHWEMLDDRGRNGSYPAALLILPAAPERLFALFPHRGILSNSTGDEAASPTRSRPARQAAAGTHFHAITTGETQQ